MQINETFEYTLLEPFEINNNGSIYMCSGVKIKSPTPRQKDMVLQIAQAVQTANFELVQKITSFGTTKSDLMEAEKAEQANESDDEQVNKIKQMTMSLFSSAAVDIVKLQGWFRSIVLSEGTVLMPDEAPINSARYNKISIRDSVNLLSGYVATFIMPILT